MYWAADWISNETDWMAADWMAVNWMAVNWMAVDCAVADNRALNLVAVV